MKKMTWKKSILAGILVLALVLVGFRFSFTYAASKIDVTKECSLTLKTADSGEFAEILSRIELNARLYLVASLDSSGSYTEKKEFASLDIKQLRQGKKEWQEAAKEAEGLAAQTEPDAEINMIYGTGTAKHLKSGIYLVLVEKKVTDFYEYQFAPYLIAVPDNLYYHTGNLSEDEWQYDVSGYLKPEQSPRYGDLEIRKTLTSYNTLLKDATFVFQVEGTDREGNVVYSNVVSTTHNKAGSKAVVMKHLPAGMRVTVTEVYSGASYRLETAPEQTTSIVADERMSVEFHNVYDDKLIPGNGVTNHFTYDEKEGWQWSQLKDNSTVNE